MSGVSGAGAGERWPEVWARRRLDPSKGSVLAQLLAADGFDTGFGDVEPEIWSGFVETWADRLGLTPGSAVFEVGCGAGAFLHELRRLGCRVSGLDISPALIEIARATMPDGEFEVAGADELALEPRTDAVISFGVFGYLPSLDYAQAVLERMAAKAERVVAVFDLPDAAREDEAMAERIASAGGRDAYAERYAGLDHLYFSREWVVEAMRACGLRAIEVADQDLSRYRNGRHRFNAWGRLPADA